MIKLIEPKEIAEGASKVVNFEILNRVQEKTTFITVMSKKVDKFCK